MEAKEKLYPIIQECDKRSVLTTLSRAHPQLFCPIQKPYPRHDSFTCLHQAIVPQSPRSGHSDSCSSQRSLLPHHNLSPSPFFHISTLNLQQSRPLYEDHMMEKNNRNNNNNALYNHCHHYPNKSISVPVGCGATHNVCSTILLHMAHSFAMGTLVILTSAILFTLLSRTTCMQK